MRRSYFTCECLDIIVVVVVMLSVIANGVKSLFHSERKQHLMVYKDLRRAHAFKDLLTEHKLTRSTQTEATQSTTFYPVSENSRSAGIYS